MKYNTVLDTIGDTPVIRINRLFAGNSDVWMKTERANPGASIKDRIGLSMIEDAEIFIDSVVELAARLESEEATWRLAGIR